MTEAEQRIEVANHFPPEVRDALVQAARTPVASEADLSRLKAINQAIERARLKYPKLFRVEVLCA